VLPGAFSIPQIQAFGDPVVPAGPRRSGSAPAVADAHGARPGGHCGESNRNRAGRGGEVAMAPLATLAAAESIR